MCQPCGFSRIVTLVTPKTMTPVKKNKKMKNFVKCLTKILIFLFFHRENGLSSVQV